MKYLGSSAKEIKKNYLTSCNFLSGKGNNEEYLKLKELFEKINK